MTEAGGLYQPVYSVQGLVGAVYEITAAEDIYTLDGTLRASKGEVVDTVTTGADGTATSKELYLGKYEVKEITAPYGMVLNEEIHAVELVYTQLFQQLFYLADHKYGGSLPVHCHFIMDEFANGTQLYR